MNNIGKAIFLWGLICLVGFGVYQFFLGSKGFPQPLVLWSVLSIIGIVVTLKIVPSAMKLKVVWVWLAVVIIGMIYHWLSTMRIGIQLPLFFGAWGFWALLMTIGFLATGYTWRVKRNYYYAIGILNALVFVALVLAPEALGEFASALLAIVSGIPLIYDGWRTDNPKPATPKPTVQAAPAPPVAAENQV
jgi:hypothetical protein